MAHSVTTGLWSVHTGPLNFSNFISTPFRFWILPTVREWHSMPPTLRDIFHHPVTTWQLSVPHHHSKPHYHNSFFHCRLHILSLSFFLSLPPPPLISLRYLASFPRDAGTKERVFVHSVSLVSFETELYYINTFAQLSSTCVMSNTNFLHNDFICSYCTDKFRPRFFAIFRELASFSTCVAVVSTFVAETLRNWLIF